MLTITVGATESFDDAKNEFVELGGFELQLEHSLVSLSKWEEIHEKPFLGLESPTTEETLSYIRCMIVTDNVPDEILYRLTNEDFEAINSYINRKMTATWFSNASSGKKSGEIITAELIYFWMTAFSIDIEWERRHLNKLFTLIKIADAKNQQPKKMSRAEQAAQQRALNRQRRERLGHTG